MIWNKGYRTRKGGKNQEKRESCVEGETKIEVEGNILDLVTLVELPPVWMYTLSIFILLDLSTNKPKS